MTLSPSPPGGTVYLKFRHWYSLQDRDVGFVEVSVNGGDWNQVSATFEHQSGAWSPYLINLGAYLGQSVRFAFRIVEDGDGARYSGWYVDEFQLLGESEVVPEAPVFLSVDYTPGPPALTWNNPAGNFDFISIYGGQTADFAPNLGNRVALVSSTSFDDFDRPGWGTYYKISTVKQYGSVWHESAPTGPITLTAIEEDGNDTPNLTALRQNYPNPFNPTTTICFTLLERTRVTLSIYDVGGRLVRTLVDETMGEGYQERSWDGKDASGSQVGSGVYFYRLTAGDRTLTKKMVLLK
jgi:hypothetical protein